MNVANTWGGSPEDPLGPTWSGWDAGVISKYWLMRKSGRREGPEREEGREKRVNKLGTRSIACFEHREHVTGVSLKGQRWKGVGGDGGGGGAGADKEAVHTHISRRGDTEK